MLQAPSHLSRVCGHGHIKKFWLMQTQKENQACENKSSVLFPSPPSRPSNRGSVKGLDSSHWGSSPSTHNVGYADASATSSKHSSFTCAESLSPPSQSCKASPPPSPHSTGSSGVIANKEHFAGQMEGVDSLSRTLCRDAHPATPSPRTHPLNVASEYHCQGSAVAIVEADRREPSSLLGNYSNEEPLSTSTEHSPDSHSSYVHSRCVQDGFSVQRPLETTSCNPTVKVEDRSSPSSSRELKPSISHVRFSCPASGMDFASDKGRVGGFHVSRMHEIVDPDQNRPQSVYVQHPALKACSLCGTTKTPMWRSGPQGPKSLCNACGIRFKKYRSYPGQSESPELVPSTLLGPPASSKPLSRPLKRKQNSILSSCDPPRPQKVCIKPAVPDVVVRHQLKKSKWHQLVLKREHDDLQEFNNSSSPWCAHAGPPSLKKIYGCSPFQSKFKKLAPMDEHLNVSRVFAKDEEEAAVLLMHLSCGLVY